VIWSGVHRSFDDLPADDEGFVHPRWLEKSLDRLREIQSAADPSPNPGYRITDVVLAVSGGTGAASVLDVGGNLGQTGLDVMKRLPAATVAWTVLEREDLLTAAGAAVELPASIEFVADEHHLGSRRFDVVHLGSVLQYFDDWRLELERLIEARMRPGSWLVISDAMADSNIESFVTSQAYFESSLRMHFLDLGELLSHLKGQGVEPVLVEPYLTPHTANYYPEQGLPPDRRIRHPHNLVLRLR